MKPGRGAAKGSGFERKMARELSQWFYGAPNYLWRRPGSGYIKIHYRHTGDIIPLGDKPVPWPWPFHVELKFYKDLDLIKLITDADKSFIKKTWFKATKEARQDLDVILLVKENRHKELVFMRVSTYVKLGLDRSGSELLFNDNSEDSSVLGFAWAELRAYKGLAQVYFDKTRLG